MPVTAKKNPKSARKQPTNKKLLRIASKHRPPQSWYEERDFASDSRRKR